MSVRTYSLWLMIATIINLSSCIEEENPSETAQVANDAEIQQLIIDQGQQDQAIETGTGLVYVPTLSNPAGQIIADGDCVYVHYKARLTSGTIVDSTADFRDLPEREDRPDGILSSITPLILGLQEGIPLLQEGEQATFYIPSYLGFGGSNIPQAIPGLPPFSVLIYDMEIVEVRSQAEQIDNFFRDNGLFAELITASGVSIVRFIEGSPDTQPVEDDQVTVTFRGKFLSGEEFDINRDSTFIVTIGTGDVIPGFDEAIQNMNQGDSIIAVIPYEQAYGETGLRDEFTGALTIPPFAPILFEMTLVKSQEQQILEYISVNGITDTTSTESGLFSQILEPGGGASPVEADRVQLEFDLFYYEDQDSSLVPVQSVTGLELELGAEDNNDIDFVTNGLEEGVELMQVGERRRLIMTSALGFGSRGEGTVPGRRVIVYDVRLVSIL